MDPEIVPGAYPGRKNNTGFWLVQVAGKTGESQAILKANNRFANVAYLNNEELLRYDKDPVFLNKVSIQHDIDFYIEYRLRTPIL